MIRLEGVSAGYYDKEIIKDISFECRDGEITVIVGNNGCGKSTVIKTACGILKTVRGSVTVDGKNISEYKPKELARHVSVLPQVRNVPSITAKSLVMHGRFPYMGFPRTASKEDKLAVEHAMEIADVKKFENTDVSALSGGERQRVYIAMLLAQNTKTVLLDEPATFLDIGCQFEVIDLIASLRQQGKAVVCVMHDLSQALSVADNVLLMDRGEQIYLGDAKGLVDSGLIQKIMKVKPFNVEDANSWHFGRL